MKFTIITTVLDNENFISGCLSSIQNQKIKKNEVEHIIVDGGSSDRTVEIIKKIKNKNKNIRLFIKKRYSIYKAINFGIKKSKNNYIGILHSDDFYFNNNVLSFVKKQFDKNKNIDAIYSNIKIVKRNDSDKILRYFKSKQLNYRDFLKCDHPPHTSLFFKKSVFKKYGNYNEKFKIASDFEFMLRVFGIKHLKSKYFNKTFITMRSGGTSTQSIKNVIVANYEVYRSFKENKININLFYIILKILRKLLQFRLFN